MLIRNTSKVPRVVRTGVKVEKGVKVGGDEPRTILPGNTLMIDGFDPKEPFNADMLNKGFIAIATDKASDDPAQTKVDAAVVEAQNAVKQANDAVAAAEKAIEEGETNETKKALADAKAAQKAANAQLDKAEKAAAKG